MDIWVVGKRLVLKPSVRLSEKSVFSAMILRDFEPLLGSVQTRSSRLKWKSLLLPSLSLKEAQFEYSLDSNTTVEGLILASGVPSGSRQAASIASLTLGSHVFRSQVHRSLGLPG